MRSYVKFLREILSNKRKQEEHEAVTLIEECSVAIKNSICANLHNPDSFSNPYLIGNVCINCAICNLGSSLRLMPISMCKKLDIGEMRPTIISL